ncbi:hypothetical protein [Clostridium beijerinckii]|uniref:hypothetical protein n=1 Tax=Clostridium beijerinckii TaxID=1520 RepID=UPI00147DB256|nr:hypothetical protein [Clostridium beijerinckii]
MDVFCFVELYTNLMNLTDVKLMQKGVQSLIQHKFFGDTAMSMRLQLIMNL